MEHIEIILEFFVHVLIVLSCYSCQCMHCLLKVDGIMSYKLYWDYTCHCVNLHVLVHSTNVTSQAFWKLCHENEFKQWLLFANTLVFKESNPSQMAVALCICFIFGHVTKLRVTNTCDPTLSHCYCKHKYIQCTLYEFMLDLQCWCVPRRLLLWVL